MAGQDSSPQAAQALEMLCRIYWPPLYAYARRDNLSPHDAQDAVQDFISLLIERKDFANLGPEKGRFRSFLLAALKNFLISRARAGHALKRGGGRPALSLDDVDPEVYCAPELMDQFTPEKAFDRRWARTVMGRALENLRTEHQTPQQARVYAALQPTLMEGGPVNERAALAADLGMTPGALGVAATRMRRRYRILVEEEVKQTLTDAADFAEEMRALREAWV